MLIIIIIVLDMSFIFKKYIVNVTHEKIENVLNYVHLYKDVIH